MFRPSRTRRILKWTGFCVCILISIAAGLTIDASFQVPGFLKVGDGYARVGSPGPTGNWKDTPYVAATGFLQTVFAPNGQFLYVIVPLWIPLLLTAFPTAWLWHRDRQRIRPGCCLRCGYDLTGNLSGVCSECGEKATLANPPSATP